MLVVSELGESSRLWGVQAQAREFRDPAERAAHRRAVQPLAGSDEGSWSSGGRRRKVFTVGRVALVEHGFTQN